MNQGLALVLPLIYLAFARLALGVSRPQARDALFAAVNLVGVYLIFYPWGHLKQTALYAAYVGIVCCQYLVLRTLAARSERAALLALWTPVALLVAIKYFPALCASLNLPFFRNTEHPLAFYFIGLSYLAFRSTRLVMEIRTGAVARPTLCQYVSFCFFLPTVAVGPIGTYASFSRGLNRSATNATPLGGSCLRLLVGLVKYKFLASFCNQLSYSGLLLDGHPHHWMDLPVAAICYYLFLYCNFSGFCDLAIGAAGLLDIPVEENFDRPFASRNVKDFWNRWHITLSTFMRDLVFAPWSKYLIGRLGPARANHAIALAIATVFLLVGIWHGVGWNYTLFGAMHALGVVVNHYYTIWLKQRLGKARLKSYHANRLIHAAAVCLTFVYVTASFFLFANDLPAIQQILAAIRRT